MSTKGIRSLQPLLAQAETERAAQLQHFDSLGSKAGILLGLSGALIALSGRGVLILIVVGRAAAVASAGAALASFWPRAVGAVDMKELREDYLAAEETFTKIALLDSQVEMLTDTNPELKRKARRLKISMSFLAGSALLLAIGTGLH